MTFQSKSNIGIDPEGTLVHASKPLSSPYSLTEALCGSHEKNPRRNRKALTDHGS
jgi:hypothetical protein